MEIVMNLSTRTFTNADKEIVTYDGSEVSWRISAYVIVIQDDKVLLVKSKGEKVYDVPGGGIEIGESIEEAIHREVMEEAGAKVKIGQLIDTVEDWFYYKKGTYHQTIQLYYTAELDGEIGKPTDDDIHFVDFVPLVDIEKYALPDAVERALKKM